MTLGWEWRHAPEARAEDLVGFWRKSVSCELDSERKRSTFRPHWGQRNLCATGAARDGGGRWKSHHRKIVYLSPYVEEPLNSKVIKGFVPELRSRYVFFVFRDSYVLCIYVMNILCTFHIYISGYVTNQQWLICHKTKLN